MQKCLLLIIRPQKIVIALKKGKENSFKYREISFCQKVFLRNKLNFHLFKLHINKFISMFHL